MSRIVRRRVRAYVEVTRGGADVLPAAPDFVEPARAPRPDPEPAPRPQSTQPTPPARDAAAVVGAPPPMPPDVPAPTAMPGPRDIPPGAPEDPAAPPTAVPRGDSGSLRRAGPPEEFSLVYRRSTFVITRAGAVGTRGVWRVVEYPTPGSASYAYAQECSRWVSEGYSDHRE